MKKHDEKLSESAWEHLESLLKFAVDSPPGRLGALVINYDYNLLASYKIPEEELENIRMCALELFSDAFVFADAVNYPKLQQLIGKTKDFDLVIADFGGGLIVTVGAT